MIWRTIGVVIVSTLIASLCGGDSNAGEQIAEADNPAEFTIGDGFGNYDVGNETITIPDPTGGGRDLTLDVWFPLDDSTGLTPWRLTFPGDLVFESVRTFATTRDNISADGPFPLVIYSHGDSALRTTASNYTEAIASHGYIVAAPDHLGDTVFDGSDDRATQLFNRPNDISAVIDAMVDPNRSETAGFVDHVNADQIAVTGHQAFTVYATVAGFDNARGEYVADERVGAIIALSPDVGELDDERFAAIDIPALIMVGTEDSSASAIRPWELSNSSPSYRVELVGGEHLSFTDVCGYLAMLDAAPDADAGGFRTLMNGFRRKGCEADDFPYQRALDVTNTFAATFLDSVFRGADAIHPDQVVRMADVTYAIK